MGQAELFAQQIVDAPARPHRKFGESGKTDLWRNGQSGPQVALPITRDDRIDGQADRVDSSRLAPIYSFKIQRIVAQPVQLEYIWHAAMRRDVIDSRSTERSVVNESVRRVKSMVAQHK